MGKVKHVYLNLVPSVCPVLSTRLWSEIAFLPWRIILRENRSVFNVSHALMMNVLPQSPPDTTSAFTFWDCIVTSLTSMLVNRLASGLLYEDSGVGCIFVPLFKRYRPSECHQVQSRNLVLCSNSEKMKQWLTDFTPWFLVNIARQSSAKIAEFSSLSLIKNIK